MERKKNKRVLQVIAVAAILASVFTWTAIFAQNSATDVSYHKELDSALEELNGLIGDNPSRYHHNRAEVYFRLGRFADSLTDYDNAVRFGWPHDDNSCWERGLAQYYVGDYKSGAEQFARYHRVGALDIENGLWRFLCIAEEEGIEKARETMFEYTRKLRKPFPALLELYMGRGKAEAVLEEAKHGVTSSEEQTTNLFYAHYYLGKYYEIMNQKPKALVQVETALKHPIQHFMYACALADVKRLGDSSSDTND
jgi:lipoprotein NlpI